MYAGHNPKLFPDGPPIELLLACSTLSDPDDAVDPMVAIACDYLDRIKDRVSGTLDKMVSDPASHPVTYLAVVTLYCVGIGDDRLGVGESEEGRIGRYQDH